MYTFKTAVSSTMPLQMEPLPKTSLVIGQSGLTIEGCVDGLHYWLKSTIVPDSYFK